MTKTLILVLAHKQLFLKDVDASKGPLAEAAFLNQASNVSVAYSFAKER